MRVANCLVLLSNWHEDDRTVPKNAVNKCIVVYTWMFKREKMIAFVLQSATIVQGSILKLLGNVIVRIFRHSYYVTVSHLKLGCPLLQ